MPRGNDTADAVKELASQFGTFQNAEELIASWRTARKGNVEVAAVRRQQVDQKASDELDAAKVDKALGDNLTLVGEPKVRGGKVSAVATDALGRAHHVILDSPKDLNMVTHEDPINAELNARRRDLPVPEGEGLSDPGGSDKEPEQTEPKGDGPRETTGGAGSGGGRGGQRGAGS